ncbi:MAG: cupin domain-containing protein [Planctomycetes bacterium]|nr:cupin domain-containing protein [Planctomycetota bacterium]
MFARYLLEKDREAQVQAWGKMAWLSGPKLTGAEHLTVLEARLDKGGGHSFHFHPHQEELIFVVEGRIEQWLEQESKILGAGDALFIPRETVHASFNVFAEPARVLAILGPCAGPEGYECVDVFERAPWKDLRAQKEARHV